MVLFFGDFFQFDPVLQTSLLLPAPRDRGGQRPESLVKHLAAHRLFLQFTTVVILQEQGMPVVVTQNQFIGLKVVNGAPFKAVDIFPDPAAGTIALASDVTLHLGPPVASLLQSDDSAGLAIPGLPNGIILFKSKTVAIPSQMRGKEGGWRGKPGFRAQSWDGLHLFRKPARSDFIEPKNVLDKDMRDAILKLERQGEETRRRFEQDHRHEPWFQEWDAMPELAQAAEAADEDAGVCGGPHPPGQRLPGLLVDGEENEDVAYVYAFARRAVVLWLQPGPAPAQNNGAYGVKPPSLGSVSATCTEWVSSVSYLLTPTPWKKRSPAPCPLRSMGRFQAEPADDIPGLWRSLEGQLGARIRSHFQNIALLRVSADDARADRKLQGLEEDSEDAVDGLDFGDQVGDDDGVGEDVESINPQAHHEAFLDVLSAVRRSEIKDMAATSALRRLDEEARAVDPSQDDNNAAQRGRHFYTMLQDLQDSPFRGMGLPSREEIDAVLKVQKKEDSSVTAKIQGRFYGAEVVRAWIMVFVGKGTFRKY
ncbi:predicted protein [Chaetomium globosum CBS 148.51]|uniref:Uncharacterized protein n=1 Tax=Chaetomium globosum (strain ATCC 6205 / CBS 148.51 / DSM 1962 / NBRC 6347 / NRRL 1970) TaxID=306901 RepID=Q2GXB3_CHAGB|nr:uncharacterized protein CHGG_07391 [Chaetomium globosum CBS 148.51]EAQ86138.1 predicted protein [Chaetomium globosum CBS 148.51]